MQKKQFVLQNKGMNRDLSISKVGESSAYENHNIRILARDHDTLLSVTNERGNKLAVIRGLQNDVLRISEDGDLRLTEDGDNRIIRDNEQVFDGFAGILLGWNVLNNHIILFTHQCDGVDHIYRVDYNGESFDAIRLFTGNLRFDSGHPIESVVYFESDDVQKIYWVDGVNVLRFMNFMAKQDERDKWNEDSTYFDSNRAAEFNVTVEISKDNSGSNRPNGVVQYLITYFNKHGQETGYVWVSDLVYLSPFDRGGAADEINANSVRLSISNLDERFSHFRVYSIFRSSFDGTVVSYLVEEGETKGGLASVVDDGAHLVAQDANRLLYLGSQPVHAWTLEHKDQTLFLGNLESVGHDYTDIESAIKSSMYDSGGVSQCITFEYSDNDSDGRHNIPYVKNESTYSYENQLRYTSSEIATFKGGEKYRFALKFQLADGTETPAFWIGDKENTLYPNIDESSNSIRRAIAHCVLPESVVIAIRDSKLDIKTVQLCIAEATYADRSVKAQGIICPTMFNTWDRYNNRTYAIPSWISRPRNSGYANRHFQPIKSASKSTGEISCNWWSENSPIPTPYYRYINYGSQQQSYEVEYGGDTDYDYLFVVYEVGIDKWDIPPAYVVYALVYKVTLYSSSAISLLWDYQFDSILPYGTQSTVIYDDESTFKIVGRRTPVFAENRGWDKAIKTVYRKLTEYLLENYSLSVADDEVIELDTLFNWFEEVNNGLGILNKRTLYFTAGGNSSGYTNGLACLNYTGQGRWRIGERSTAGLEGSKLPSRATKHIMFVDENIVTLNSPEFDYEAVSIDKNDGLKLRIIGAAKITSGLSDYTIDATAGKKPGSNLIDGKFSWTLDFGNPDGLLSWPLWEDRNLDSIPVGEDESLPDVKDRTSAHYHWGSTSVFYWLHLWNRSGLINGYNALESSDDNNETGDYGHLHRKVFANLKYSYETRYRPLNDAICTYELSDLRQYNYTSSQYVQLNVNDENEYYNGNVQMSLMPMRGKKYPILYSASEEDTSMFASSDYAFLYSSEPVQIEYLSNPHAVMSLGSYIDNGKYHQRILPYLDAENCVSNIIPVQEGSTTDALVPWINQNTPIGYAVDEELLTIPGITDDDRYILIGELYQEYDAEHPDTRYGGITDMDIANCRFITAGPQFLVSEMNADGNDVIYANQGDTFFQRWDCLKTKPFSSDSVNNVIDITSVMVETHINIDGRTDLQRGIDNIASIDTASFGRINRVYSQPNNYRIQRDLDEDANTDSYRSSITWTLPKSDLANIDEWTHITLGASLNLDGDKGDCNAIRRFQNSLIAFQDRGISEILFNSRTQLSTENGVPVEIANSGKVDGKRYITNHYGCTNKWSIVEGKNALYFVDNINKAFCSFSGNGIESISTKLGFDVWFRSANSLNYWEPINFSNIRSYYDRVNADVYLVKGSNDDMACLVYNENLQTFTSFFDYGYVPMMANVDDKFVSFGNNRLWLQNEGLYCNFFGQQKDFWIQYRVTPNPFSDKIWTNLDYRADFYDVLNENGESVVPEENLINGDIYEGNQDLYKENETFDMLRVWNEYQTTGDIDLKLNTNELDPVRKKFRIWRVVIPRALRKGSTARTLDRIRNPWINLLVRKGMTSATELMQLHDLTVTYFE